MTSDPERAIETQIKQASLPEPEQQYKFLPNRKYLADFCWPAYRLIVEVQGGGFNRGRHHRPAGYEADCERMNAAQLDGWRILYVTPAMISDGRAIAWIEKALEVQA